MMFILLILSILYPIQTLAVSVPLRRFPKDFIFGAATASYQIEGAWNEDGKGESIWDRLVHTQPNFTSDRSNGDIAADSYHNYKRDVHMLKELGVQAYRLSISWPRILPNGFPNKINQKGIDFYNNYINELLKHGIKPIVTLYHWDLPQYLQDLGGFLNPYFPTWFEDYARIVYENFGDRVKMFITFNEPKQICFFGYGSDVLAPVVNLTGLGDYLCAKYLSLAHAKAYRLYDRDFREVQKGEVGITCAVLLYEPDSGDPEDVVAAELMRQGAWSMYLDPIFSSQGGFPSELLGLVAAKSELQGYPRTRMVDFSDEERKYVRGTYDFLGVNYYFGYRVSATKYLKDYPIPSLGDDLGVGLHSPKHWMVSEFNTMPQPPKGMYKVLKQLKQRYGNLTIYITENGWPTKPGLADDNRIAVLRNCWSDLLDAMAEGIQVRGYMAWSLMDNFEWYEGYRLRFGLYEVDFADPSRTRSPRKSAYVYKQLIRSRILDLNYEPNTTLSINEV